jgi:hypothetical protein
MESEPKWLVLYALALAAQERGLQDVSDALTVGKDSSQKPDGLMCEFSR